MVDQCLPSSITSNALINSSSHLQTWTIWKRQVSKGGFEEYELRDTMGILTWNHQYTKYAYNVVLNSLKRSKSDKLKEAELIA